VLIFITQNLKFNHDKCQSFEFTLRAKTSIIATKFIFLHTQMKKRVAINGFGRIGRAAARIIMQDHQDTLELVGVNDPSRIEQSALFMAYDSNFGRYPGTIEPKGDDVLVIDGQEVSKFTTRNIEDLPWGDLEVDIVLECTGVFRTEEGASKHLTQGAKKVVISAPGKDDSFDTYVIGANCDQIRGDETLVSNASCTTNCLAPIAKVLDDEFGIESGLMTTIHAYTTSQPVLDLGGKDMRRGRAAALNMVPTSTGAAKAVALVLPALKGKLTGMAVRVPTPTVSLVDLTVKVKKSATVEAVNAAMKAASEKNPGILGYSDKPLVSMDFKQDSRSSIFDADSTYVMGDLIKVLSWYDNEWGYSCRLVELAEKL